jgi:hypothetical protein
MIHHIPRVSCAAPPGKKCSAFCAAAQKRKGFDGLYALVRDRLDLEPLSGHVFLFSNAQTESVEAPLLGFM